ncbi:MAG: class E sortase [Propioniciclava sp.]
MSTPRPARAVPARPGRARRLFHEFVGLLGEVFVTVGMFCLLFAAWQLWWTDVVADQDSAQVIASLEGADSGWVTPDAVEMGDAFAIIRIPRFGADYARPIYEGTTRDILKRGVGHYEQTVMPGQVGNFSLAGHRVTYGKPFNQIAELVPGDRVIIETADTYYVYSVVASEIVLPTDVRVVLPVPNQPGVVPTTAMLTMTSCHPEFSSRERYVQHAVLEQTLPRAGGLPPEVLAVTTP